MAQRARREASTPSAPPPMPGGTPPARDVASRRQSRLRSSTCSLRMPKATGPRTYPPLRLSLPMIRDDLALAVRRALADAGLPEPPGGVVVDLPKQRDHGDWATPAALALAKPVGRPPMEIAQQLAAALEAAAVPHLARAEAARPGFVNLYLAPTWLHDVLREVVAAGD